MNFFSKNQLKYALILCGVTVLCLAAMEVTGQNKSFEHSPFAAISSIIAPLIIWFLAIREKKKELNGQMTFKQGLAQGFKLSLLYGLITPFIFAFYYLFINPSIVEHVKEIYQLQNASNATAIGTDVAVQVITSIIGLTVYSAIISFFLRSKKKS
jgi:hypothetical protein